MTSVPGFLTKTFEIFSTPEFADCCGWGPNGDTIIIRKIEQFSKQVLPRYFKHSNFQSFVRQLNMYDFHKTVQDPNHGEFQHQYFRQNKPELLIHIKRKANNRAAETIKKLSSSSTSGKTQTTSSTAPTGTVKPSSGSSSGGVGSSGSITSSSGALVVPPTTNKSQLVPATGSGVPSSTTPDMDELNRVVPEELALEAQAVLKELEQQKAMRAEFEQRMEARLAELEGENHTLKTLFLETHQKTQTMQERLEKVLKTMYSLFLANQQPGGNKALAGRMMNMLLPDIQGNYGNTNGYNTSGGSMRQLMDVPRVDDPFMVNMVPGGEPLDRLPSIDFSSETVSGGNGTMPINYPSDPFGVNSYLLNNNRYSGAELSSINSFDFAAASVSAPGNLKSFKSFDASLFSPTDIGSVSEENSPLPDNREFYSDRVTILPDDQPTVMPTDIGLPISSSATTSASTSKKSSKAKPVPGGPLTSSSTVIDDMMYSNGAVGSSSSSSNAQHKRKTTANNTPTSGSGVIASSLDDPTTVASLGVPLEKKVRYNLDNIDTNVAPANALVVPGIATTVPFTNTPADSSTLVPPGDSETMSFISLLNRNQNTTLNRLDSLELTLASLLDGTDADLLSPGPVESNVV